MAGWGLDRGGMVQYDRDGGRNRPPSMFTGQGGGGSPPPPAAPQRKGPIMQDERFLHVAKFPTTYFSEYMGTVLSYNTLGYSIDVNYWYSKEVASTSDFRPTVQVYSVLPFDEGRGQVITTIQYWSITTDTVVSRNGSTRIVGQEWIDNHTGNWCKTREEGWRYLSTSLTARERWRMAMRQHKGQVQKFIDAIGMMLFHYTAEEHFPHLYDPNNLRYKLQEYRRVRELGLGTYWSNRYRPSQDDQIGILPR